MFYSSSLFDEKINNNNNNTVSKKKYCRLKNVNSLSSLSFIPAYPNNLLPSVLLAKVAK